MFIFICRRVQARVQSIQREIQPLEMAASREIERYTIQDSDEEKEERVGGAVFVEIQQNAVKTAILMAGADKFDADNVRPEVVLTAKQEYVQGGDDMRTNTLLHQIADYFNIAVSDLLRVEKFHKYGCSLHKNGKQVEMVYGTAERKKQCIQYVLFYLVLNCFIVVDV